MNQKDGRTRAFATLVQRDALEARLFNSLGGSERPMRNSVEATSVVPENEGGMLGQLCLWPESRLCCYHQL